MHPIQFGIGQGRLGGEFLLTPQENGALRAKGELELRRVDISRLMQAAGAGGAGSLGGVGRIDAVGKSLSDMLGHGDGELTLVTVGGELSSLLVDLSGLQFGNALLSALGIPARTKIECLIGDFALRRGQLTTRSLLLDTENYVVNGGGSADMAREVLDWRLRTSSKRFSVGSLPTPIAITGSFKNPSILPEVGELAARGGAAVGLGVLFPPLALLPTIQLGVGENSDCEQLTRPPRLIPQAGGVARPERQVFMKSRRGAPCSCWLRAWAAQVRILACWASWAGLGSRRSAAVAGRARSRARQVQADDPAHGGDSGLISQ